MGAMDRIVVPKIKTKIVLTVGDYFKRVSYLSNFSNAVWLLVIPQERSVERSFPFPFLWKEILLLDYCSLETNSCFQHTTTFSILTRWIHTFVPLHLWLRWTHTFVPLHSCFRWIHTFVPLHSCFRWIHTFVPLHLCFRWIHTFVPLHSANTLLRCTLYSIDKYTKHC